MEGFTAWFHRAGVYVRTLMKWVVLGLVIGAFCGVIGSAFHIGVTTQRSFGESTPGSSGACPWRVF